MPTYSERPANPQPGDRVTRPGRCHRCDRPLCAETFFGGPFGGWGIHWDDDQACEARKMCRGDSGCDGVAVDWRSRVLAAEARERTLMEAQAQDRAALTDAIMTEQTRAERAEASLAAATREADRLRHGVPVEGNFVCPDSLRADEAEARVAALEAALRGACNGIAYAVEEAHGRVVIRVIDGRGMTGLEVAVEMQRQGLAALAGAKEPTPDPRDERIKALETEAAKVESLWSEYRETTGANIDALVKRAEDAEARVKALEAVLRVPEPAIDDPAPVIVGALIERGSCCRCGRPRANLRGMAGRTGSRWVKVFDKTYMSIGAGVQRYDEAQYCPDSEQRDPESMCAGLGAIEAIYTALAGAKEPGDGR